MGLFSKKNKQQETSEGVGLFKKVFGFFRKDKKSSGASGKKSVVPELIVPEIPQLILESIYNRNTQVTQENMSHYKEYCSDKEPYTKDADCCVDSQRIYTNFFNDLKQTKGFEFDKKLAKLKSHKECSNKEAFDIFYDFAKEYVLYFEKYCQRFVKNKECFVPNEILKVVGNYFQEYGIEDNTNKFYLSQDNDFPSTAFVLYNQASWCFAREYVKYIQSLEEGEIIVPHQFLDKLRFDKDEVGRKDLIESIIFNKGDDIGYFKENTAFLEAYYKIESLKPLFNIKFVSNSFIDEMLPLLLIADLLKKTTFLPLNYYEVINDVFVERLKESNASSDAEQFKSLLAEVRRIVISENEFGIQCCLSLLLFYRIFKLQKQYSNDLEEEENNSFTSLNSETIIDLSKELKNQLCLLFAYLMVIRRKVNDPTIQLHVKDIKLLNRVCMSYDVNVNFETLYLGLKNLGI